MPKTVEVNCKFNSGFFVREDGVTFAATRRYIEGRFGKEFCDLVLDVPGSWVIYEYDGEPAPEGIAELRPVTTSVRKLDPSAWPKAAGL